MTKDEKTALLNSVCSEAELENIHAVQTGPLRNRLRKAMDELTGNRQPKTLEDAQRLSDCIAALMAAARTGAAMVMPREEALRLFPKTR